MGAPEHDDVADKLTSVTNQTTAIGDVAINGSTSPEARVKGTWNLSKKTLTSQAQLIPSQINTEIRNLWRPLVSSPNL